LHVEALDEFVVCGGCAVEVGSRTVVLDVAEDCLVGRDRRPSAGAGLILVGVDAVLRGIFILVVAGLGLVEVGIVRGFRVLGVVGLVEPRGCRVPASAAPTGAGLYAERPRLAGLVAGFVHGEHASGVSALAQTVGGVAEAPVVERGQDGGPVDGELRGVGVDAAVGVRDLRGDRGVVDGASLGGELPDLGRQRVRGSAHAVRARVGDDGVRDPFARDEPGVEDVRAAGGMRASS
jgi:hypothetical protein